MAKNKGSAKNKRTKLLAAQHTGKLRPHKHTSYGCLALVLLMAFVPLLFIGTKASAEQSYQTYAVVPAAVPKTAPVITSPGNGQVFASTDPINVKGSCPDKTLVKVFKNEVMGGAVLCSGGTFTLSIDLFIGNNSLTARAYNANDIAGPDSAPISVGLQPPGVNLNGSQFLNTTSPPAGQFYLTTEVYYRGAATGDKMSWPLTIAGGQAPYAVSISWGDGKTDLISRGAVGQFDISHVYTKAGGNYTIVIKGTDQAGNTSFLQLVAIVSGKGTSLLGSVGGGHSGLPGLQLAWQLMAFAVLIVLSFWLGEKRELRIVNHHSTRTA